MKKQSDGFHYLYLLNQQGRVNNIMTENIEYKHDDYSIRSDDVYALTKYKIVMKWLPDRPGLRILNAGCGSGEMNALLARNASWHVDAIDIDPEAIQLSQQLKADRKLDNITISQSSIEAHPGRDYDVIICNDVLEHIADDQATIQILSNMLKRDGVLCVSVPALQWLFGYHDRMLGHYRRYNRRLLVTRLSARFTVKHCRYFGGTLIPIAILYSNMLRRPYPVGKQGKNSIAGKTLNGLLALEQDVAFPMGTSLLAMATLPKP